MDAAPGKHEQLVLTFLPRIDDFMKVVQMQTPFLLAFEKSMMYATTILYCPQSRII
jgi:hypothetical protein